MSTEEMWGDLMEALKLEDEIKSLIELHTEGVYWDFKRQW